MPFPAFIADKRQALTSPWPWYAFVITTALYVTLFLNDALWVSWLELAGFPSDGILIVVSMLLILPCVICLMLVPFAHPRLVKPALVAFLILSSVIHYFSVKFGTIVNASMIQNIMETDSREAFELMTPGLLLHVLLYAGVPSMAVMTLSVKPVHTWRWFREASIVIMASLLIMGTVLAGGFKELSMLVREHHEVRQLVNPVYAMYATQKYFRMSPGGQGPVKVTSVAGDAKMYAPANGARDTLFVLMLGETARADHFSLNGYRRITNPELAGEEIINFSNAWACGTSTADSLPCMFSDLGREHYSRELASGRENILDVLAHMGIDVRWIDNNSGSKGVADRIQYVRARDLPADERNAYCSEGECYDEILAADMERQVRTLRGNAMIVLHQLGEHGPGYYKRHPQQYARFTPECSRDDIFNCSDEELNNAYDNALLYTDHVIAKTIHALKSVESERDVIMLYISDHGESLGESGVYLHGAPWDFAPEYQKHVPMVLWMSGGAYGKYHIDRACLADIRQNAFSHDNLFHTILGIFSTRKSHDYNRSLDIFNSCRNDTPA